MLRIGYIGELWAGGTCLARANALGDHGWKVARFDTTPYLRDDSRMVRALQHRFLSGPHVRRFNLDLVDFVKQVAPLDIVWIDKGRWVYPSTLQRIKMLTGSLSVHYTPDPAFSVHTSRHFERSLPVYDLCITTKRYEVERYRDNGAKRVLFTWQGIDDRFVNCARCGAIGDADRSGIVFIGHGEKHYNHLLMAVAGKHEGLKIWGDGWERYARKHPELRPFVKGGPLWGKDYVVGLASARIGLGLLSKYCPDQFTGRTFEIPASGTMLIAERTGDHQELFEEGDEAEYFSSVDELNDKITYYINNDTARERIAERGRQRALSCYHWKHALSSAIRIIEDWQ